MSKINGSFFSDKSEQIQNQNNSILININESLKV